MTENRRTFVELPTNPFAATISDTDGLFGQNNQKWTNALTRLGLVEIASHPAHNLRGEEVPDTLAVLIDTELLDSNQYAYLAMVSRQDISGLGVHMVEGLAQDGMVPKALTEEEILADMAKVTIGGVQRHKDIAPSDFRPMLDLCRDLGTIGLLEQNLSAVA